MPNAVPTNLFSVTYTDYSKEKSTTTVNTKQFADNAAYETAKANLLNSFEVVTNGLRSQTSDSLVDRESNGFPSNDLAAREKKWKVTYEDTTTFKVYTFTIPTMDDSAVTFAPNTDFVDLSVAPADQWVTDMEAFIASPTGGNINILTIERVGRNN